MKKNIVFILAIGFLITLSEARQPNPFSKENKIDTQLSEMEVKISEIKNSNDYKRYQQSFGISTYISVEEQKKILQNTHVPKLRNLEDLQSLNELEEFADY